MTWASQTGCYFTHILSLKNLSMVSTLSSCSISYLSEKYTIKGVAWIKNVSFDTYLSISRTNLYLSPVKVTSKILLEQCSSLPLHHLYSNPSFLHLTQTGEILLNSLKWSTLISGSLSILFFTQHQNNLFKIQIWSRHFLH